jgi:hypothetical protein
VSEVRSVLGRCCDVRRISRWVRYAELYANKAAAAGRSHNSRFTAGSPSRCRLKSARLGLAGVTQAKASQGKVNAGFDARILKSRIILMHDGPSVCSGVCKCMVKVFKGLDSAHNRQQRHYIISKTNTRLPTSTHSPQWPLNAVLTPPRRLISTRMRSDWSPNQTSLLLCLRSSSQLLLYQATWYVYNC